MTTQSRGDALAETVKGLCGRYRSTLSYDAADLLEDIEDAIDTYHEAAAPTGERVRLVMREDYNGLFYAQIPDSCLRDDSDPVVCYITATIPPRPSVPEIEGVAAMDAKETEA